MSDDVTKDSNGNLLSDGDSVTLIKDLKVKGSGGVTPLRDGMNLVAKEYVAAQDPEDPGVLILSRFAGAAEQMGEALLVNPFSREELSEAIQKALTMPREERIRKWKALMKVVRDTDVARWRDDYVQALMATS